MKKKNIVAGGIYVDRFGYPSLVLDDQMYVSAYHKLVPAEGSAARYLVVDAINTGGSDAQYADLLSLVPHHEMIRDYALAHGLLETNAMIDQEFGLTVSCGARGVSRKFRYALPVSR